MKKAIKVTLLLSFLLSVTGLYTIPLVSTLDPIWQNLVYRIGSLPLFFVAALIVYGYEND